MALAKYTEEINELVWERLEDCTDSVTVATIVPCWIKVAAHTAKDVPSIPTQEMFPNKDLRLICSSCGREYLFSAEEQRRYSNSLRIPPRRCPKCIHKRTAFMLSSI